MTTLTLAATGLADLTLGTLGAIRSVEWAPGDVRAVEDDAPGANGVIDTSEFHGAGSVTIGMRLHVSPFETSLRLLRAFTHGRLRPTLTITADDSSEKMMTLSRGVVTTTQGRPTHQDVVVQFSVPSGILESAVLHQETIVPGAGATSGLEFGTTLEFGPTLEFGLVDPPGTQVLVNAGDRDAYPIVRLFGPFGVEGNAADETELLNVTSGKSLVFAGMAIAEGDYLDIDFRAKTILVNGLSVQSRYDRLAFPTSSWWTLRPGTNEVAFRPDTFSGNSQSLVLWRDAYS